MPNVVTPNSAGMPQPENTGMPGGVPPGKMGGEILLSRSESIALAALETEVPARAAQRAKEESGLSDNQIRRLKARAERARQAGYTLKGTNIVLKPKNYAPDAPEEESLARVSKKGKDDDDEPVAGTKAKAAGKGAAPVKKPAAGKVREAAYDYDAELDDAVEQVLRECGADALCGPCGDRAKRLRRKSRAMERRLQPRAPVAGAIREEWSDEARVASADARAGRARGRVGNKKKGDKEQSDGSPFKRTGKRRGKKKKSGRAAKGKGWVDRRGPQFNRDGSEEQPEKVMGAFEKQRRAIWKKK